MYAYIHSLVKFNSKSIEIIQMCLYSIDEGIKIYQRNGAPILLYIRVNVCKTALLRSFIQTENFFNETLYICLTQNSIIRFVAI